MDTTNRVSADDLRQHWTCHFSYWDCPLTGLVEIDGRQYWAAQTCERSRLYRLTPIVLTDECHEYLADYRRSYHHCFYATGKREQYDGRPLDWFGEKWGARNPVKELAERPSDQPETAPRGLGCNGEIMRDDGQPTEPGFYWTLRVGTDCTPHGTPEVVELRRHGEGELFGDGFGDMSLAEIGFTWQKLKKWEE